MKRTATWLLAFGALVFLAERGVGQVPANSNLDYSAPEQGYANGSPPFAESAPPSHPAWWPFKSVGFEPKLRPFGPAETSSYGNGPRAKIGFFASYERVFWSLGSPKKSLIGSETANSFSPFSQGGNQFFPDGPTVDNSFVGAIGSWGNRWELGYIDDDNYGWLVSVLDHVSQGQLRSTATPAIAFDDPNGILNGFVAFNITGSNPPSSVVLNVGELPFVASNILLKNRLQLNGVEVTRFYRAPRLHGGGYFELLYGARWLQISDTFNAFLSGNGANAESVIFGAGGGLDSATATFTQNILDASTWALRAQNNLVGPQIGGRWFTQRARWITSLEARFAATANFQNLQLSTNLGSNTTTNQGAINSNMRTNFRGLGSSVTQHNTTFSPVGELRVNVSYQATSNVALKVGYTGLIVGNISRGSNRIDYSGVNLIGITPTGFHQTFFANGINFGVEFNR